MPTAARVEQFKKFMWITTCIASPVLEGRNLEYVFRPQPFGRQWGLTSTAMVAEYSKAQLGKDPKDVRAAIIHEDGAYGTDVAKGNAEGSKKYGFQVVIDEGYSASAPDLSSLVTKLKRGRPDVIFHTGYNPDITLFLRQARELGLRFSALVGQGAGYGVYSKLKETVGSDADFFFNVDPISIWQTNAQALKPELLPIIKAVGDAYIKAKPDTVIRSAHVGMAASNTYAFLTDVLPRAVKKYGGITSDDLRQAALDTDLPDGSTMLGFGIVRAAGSTDVRPKRARLSGRRAIYRRCKPCRLAKDAAAARAGAEAAHQLALRAEVRGPVLEVSGLFKRFGGFTAVNNVSFAVEQGEILGLIGPNGSGKSTIFNMLSGTLTPTAGSILFQGRQIAGRPPHRITNSGIGRTFQIPRPFQRLSLFENVALAGYYGQGRHSRAQAFAAAERALALVGLPADRTAAIAGLGAAGLKKLELAKRAGDRTELLLADESLGGLDEAEMGQAADMLLRIRTELGITIIWVEHIMGVLMRVVDRVMVLDHGEKIAEGLPSAVAADPRVIEVYLGTDADAVQAAAAGRA